MGKNNPDWIRFTRSKNRRVIADFNGVEVSSDGGLLLLRKVDRRIGLTWRAAKVLDAPRRSGKVTHEARSMLHQRVYGLCASWEDLNDAQSLRHDSIHQIAAGSDDVLASASTLCRFEDGQSRSAAWAINALLVERFRKICSVRRVMSGLLFSTAFQFQLSVFIIKRGRCLKLVGAYGWPKVASLILRQM